MGVLKKINKKLKYFKLFFLKHYRHFFKKKKHHSKHRKLNKKIKYNTSFFSLKNFPIKIIWGDRLLRLVETQTQELEKLSIVARETDNAILIYDSEYNLEWVNSGFTRFYGYTKDEFIQTKGSSIFDMNKKPGFKVLVQQCIEEKRSISFQNTNITRNGEKYWIQTTLTPLFDNKGNLRQLVAIKSDITQIKEAQEEIKRQTKVIITQKEEIQVKNKKITDSIKYAKQIQQAILPPDFLIKDLFSDYFVLYRPKDIVSGDFYWFEKINNKILFAAVDCTGHGVPGAFMSIVAHNLMQQAIKEIKDLHPDLIMNFLNKGIRKALRQTGDEKSVLDGMDMAFCILNYDTMILEYCGTHNPLYLYREGVYHNYEPNGYSIGGNYGEEIPPYFNQEINILKNDVIYIFSDGYVDQFGGLKNKKFLTRHFKELVLSIHTLPMNEQKAILIKEFESWKGNHEQVDDVLIIGVKI